MIQIRNVYCPMGCGETLAALLLIEGTDVRCSNPTCPRPTAAVELLGERETEHIVIVKTRSWSMQHPLRERLDGELFDCGVSRYLDDRGKPPVPRGRYRVELSGESEWLWTPQEGT